VVCLCSLLVPYKPYPYRTGATGLASLVSITRCCDCGVWVGSSQLTEEAQMGEAGYPRVCHLKLGGPQ
jgi:hypothetical protein